MLKKPLLSPLALLFCFGSFGGQAVANDVTLTGSGSSFAAPVYQGWALEFRKLTGVSVNYQALGSSAGVDQMKKRLVDYAGTDKPLNAQELKQSRLYQFPSMMSAIAIIVNLPHVASDALKLDGETLARIYAGDITQWNDPAIEKLNPDIKLPAIPIGAVHRGDGSGTTWVFTSYLSLVSPQWKRNFGAGALVAWSGGAGARGNDGVASLVRQTPGSIGYVEYAYAAHNNVSFARLKNKAGFYVSPEIENAQSAVESANWNAAPDKFSLLDAPGEKSWPITAVSFTLVPDESRTKETQDALRDFFRWSLDNGGAVARDLGYVPVPASKARAIEENWPNS